MLVPRTAANTSDAGWIELEGSNGRSTKPLSEAERSEGEQLAHRLHDELRSVVLMLPEPDRGGSAMSRTLGLDRATCQRIAASTTAAPSIETLVSLPGVLGLRLFVEAMAKRLAGGADRERLVAAGAAIDRYEQLIESLGGSQRRLRERLAASSPSQGLDHIASEDAGTREALFRAAAAVTGRWSDVLCDVKVVRPVPGNPSMTETAQLRALIGHRSRKNAVPLVVGSGMDMLTADGGPAFRTLGSKVITGSTSGLLLERFCSTPLPRITSRSAGQRVMHVVDAEESATRPLDLVMAMRPHVMVPHPAKQANPIEEVWFFITFPARRLVFDVFLHRDLARACIPALEVHLWGPDFAEHRGNRWFTRFPGGPRLELLGQGIEASSVDCYPHHREATDVLFRQLEWNPDEFVGFRCHAEYPVWRAGYCMSFDFGTPKE